MNKEQIKFEMNYGSLVIKKGSMPIKIIETINEDYFGEDVRKSQIVKYVNSETKGLNLTQKELETLREVMINELTNYFFVEDYDLEEDW